MPPWVAVAGAAAAGEDPKGDAPKGEGAGVGVPKALAAAGGAAGVPAEGGWPKTFALVLPPNGPAPDAGAPPNGLEPVAGDEPKGDAAAIPPFSGVLCFVPGIFTGCS